MTFPLNLMDITLWLAIMTITLLITSELISPRYGKITILIDRRRLRTIALILGTIFVFFIVLRIFQLIA